MPPKPSIERDPETQRRIDNSKRLPRLPASHYSCNIGFDYLEKWIERNGATFDADFQRAHVWTRQQQVAYMEYVVKCDGDCTRSGLDVYFNSPGYRAGRSNAVECVDGKQRCEAVRAWMRGEFRIFVSEFPDINGVGPDDVILGMTLGLRVHVAELSDRREVLKWYLSINSAGTQHTKEELEKVKSLIGQVESKE